MSDSDPSKGAHAHNVPTQPESQMPGTPESGAQGSSRDDIVAQARKFLAADEVRNANREQKAAFLRSKGVSDEDIKQLLDEQETAAQATTTVCFYAPSIISPISCASVNFLSFFCF